MTLRVGVAKVDITPPIGVELAGYGPYLRRRSTGVHSAIFVRAIAVESGSDHWVIASCDLLGLSTSVIDDAVNMVVQESGWAPRQICIHCTHNHSGPATILESHGWGDPDCFYVSQLAGKITTACLRAIGDLQEGTVKYSQAPLDYFSHNRMRPSPGLTRELALTKRWREPDPTTIDRHVDVLRFDRDNAPYAVIAHYSCHPVISGAHNTAIHGDYPGEALARLEASHSGVTGLFLQGALGDIDPLYSHGGHNESPEALSVFAERLVEAIATGVEYAQKLPAPVQVNAYRGEVPYDLADFRLEELRRRRDHARKVLNATPPSFESPDKAHAAVTFNSLHRTVRRVEAGLPVQRPVFVQALSVGPILFIGFNLELFHKIKRELCKRIGPQTLVLSVTHGWLGYAPTTEAFEPTAIPYPAHEVPIIAGHLPFAPNISETLIEAGTRVASIIRCGNRGIRCTCVDDHRS